MIVSPGPALSTPAWIVWRGLAAVPGLELLPVVATYQVAARGGGAEVDGDLAEADARVLVVEGDAARGIGRLRVRERGQEPAVDVDADDVRRVLLDLHAVPGPDRIDGAVARGEEALRAGVRRV